MPKLAIIGGIEELTLPSSKSDGIIASMGV